ncbi:MAG: hydroxymethylpyrimidine/phosphomethylpyrimidine kinase [Psychroserpens sp.]|jgi:hydroxymethylpyrimidine/phosphomethylpyrimidine kinase
MHKNLKKVSYILTIAGLDPSSGAGITSDIKTFEAHKLYGLSACTAVTIQNDFSFKECIWIEKNSILKQVETLFDRFLITVDKIGIVQSWEVLLAVLQTVKNRNPAAKIVLDPVLKASVGFVFHSAQDFLVFEKVLLLCDFITPNYEEIEELFPKKTIEETIEFISQRTNIYLKGGHNLAKKGWDEVYHSKIVKFNIPPIATRVFDKHVSGCVLSAALAAILALENSLENACMKAKNYAEQFLNSNSSLLGTYNYN